MKLKNLKSRYGTFLKIPIFRYFILFFICLLPVFIQSDRVNCTETNLPTMVSEPGTDTKSFDSSTIKAPEYVSIELISSSGPLVAGREGYFEIKACINDSADSENKDLTWDSRIPRPLTLQISTSAESGIRFFDNTHPDRPHNQIILECKDTDEINDKLIKKKIKYRVAPDAKTGKYSYWLDISAYLNDRNGNIINDTGSIKLSIEVDTKIQTKFLMLAVICIVVLLFIMEWVRVDVVAILMMVLLPQLGLLNARDAFRGLSSNAVIAIIGVMIISYGLNRTGLVNRVLQPLKKFAAKSPRRLVATFSSLIACISGVMQNTGAAVLFLPAVRLTASRELKIPVSKVLMPIGMAAILGGTLTMIGTSPLILLNDILPEGMDKIDFLELTPIGIALVAGGILYLSTAGMAILKKISHPGETRKTIPKDELLESYPPIHGPYEIHIPDNYMHGTKDQEIIKISNKYLVNIVAVAGPGDIREEAPPPGTVLKAGMALCLYGPKSQVQQFIKDYTLTLMDEPQIFSNDMFNPSIAGIVEAVVAHRADITGKTIRQIRFRETFGVSALAVHKNGKTYYKNLAEIPLDPGDIVLVHGSWERFQELHDFQQNFVIISPFEKEFHKPKKAKWALIWFAVALSLMFISNFYFRNDPDHSLPLSICLMIGALGMIVSRVMTISDAYLSVDWRTVFLLGGLIPLGMAVEQTGTAQWMAKGIVFGIGSFMSPLLLLFILACLSCCFTMVISNVGACALLVPLGISLANQIGIDPRIAAIVVGIGVSNSFILPTHQVNALYMGPGKYSTIDYIKIGGILSLIYIFILVAMVYLFYL